MKRKLFIALYTAGVVLAIVSLNVIVTIIKKNPSTPVSAEEEADTSIAQFAERPNGRLNDTTMSKLFFLLEYLFPRTEALTDGCSLRFSFAPDQNAVEPQGPVRYTIFISNHGKDPCENTSLSLYYTDKETFVSSEPAPTASDYFWSIGSLPSGQTYKIIVTTKTTVNDGGQLLSEGCVTADNGSDICSQNVIFVQKGASTETILKDKLLLPFISGRVWGQVFNDREFGIWVWISPIEMSPAYAQEVLAVTKKNGFNVIYLTVDDYLYIEQLEGEERAERKDAYMKALSVFVEGAHAMGIEVDILGGGKDWAMDENRWRGYALIELVKEYNNKYPKAAVRGLQYDVEPYLLTEYDHDKKKVLIEFVEFVDESARRMKDVPARFSIVIPHFYDSKQNWTPEYRYNGETSHTYTHLLKVLSQKEDTSMIIMAYRNFFDEENGTKAISEQEIKEATEKGYSTKIIIAQETGNVPPEYVTFYDYPKVSLFDALSEIQNYFDQYNNFGGTAVHYFDSFLKLD